MRLIINKMAAFLKIPLISGQDFISINLRGKKLGRPFSRVIMGQLIAKGEVVPDITIRENAELLTPKNDILPEKLGSKRK